MSSPWDKILLLNGQGSIELLDTMPDTRSDDWQETNFLMDKAIVAAARVSFDSKSRGNEADKKLLFRLMRDHHTSPFEMVEFKFRIRAPVVVWWQWARHRMASYNAQSGRYTPFEEDGFYIPKPNQWRLQSKDNKQGSEGFIDTEQGEILSKRLYEYTTQGYELYTEALEMGIAREQARFFLPGWISMYNWIVKVDLKNLLDFIRLRNAPDAQFEIRTYAEAIYEKILKPLVPWTVESFEKYVLKVGDNE